MNEGNFGSSDRPRTWLWLLGTCLGFWHMACLAQSTHHELAGVDEPVHSLSEAIELALLNRLDIRMSQTEVQAAQVRVRDAEARLHPRLGLSLEFSNTRRWDDYTGISAEYEIPGAGRKTIDITSETSRYLLQPVLEASYNLYTGGGDRALLNQASSMLQASELGGKEAVQRVILDVAHQHLALRRSCANWRTANAALRLAEERYRLKRERRTSGRVADIELRTDELSLLEAKQQQSRRYREVGSAHARYVGAVFDHPGQMQGPGNACNFRSTLEEDLLSVKSASDGSPQNDRHSQDVVTARAQLAVEKAARHPRVTLFARYGHVGRQDSGLDDLVSDVRRQEAVLGLRLSYELYDGGLSDARIDAARLNLHRRELAREEHQARMARKRFNQLARQQEVEQALKLARSRYELALSRFSLAEKRFKAGQASAIARLESKFKRQEAYHALELAEINKASVDMDTHYLEASSQPENSIQE